MTRDLHTVRQQWRHTTSGEDLPDQDQLIEVEEALLIRIPRPLRGFLLELSDLQPPGWELCTCHDPQLFSYLAEITAQAWDEGLPRHLLPLAFNDSAFVAMEESGVISLWSRRFGDVIEQFESLEDWIDSSWG